MIVSPNLGLKIWNSTTDPFNSSQLADNFRKVDEHDHANGRGKQIPTGGLADGSITNAKLDPNLTLVPSDNTVSTIKIQDSAVSAAKLATDSVTTVKIANANVTAAKIASEAWTSHSPSLTAVSGGSNTVTQRYIKVGRTVFVQGQLTLGTGGSFSGDPTVALPPYSAATSIGQVGVAFAYDASLTKYIGGVCLIETGTPTVMRFRVGDLILDDIDSTSPFTWATSDYIRWSISYEAAA